MVDLEVQINKKIEALNRVPLKKMCVGCVQVKCIEQPSTLYHTI